MERTVLLDNMKKTDNIFLFCWVLLLGCFIVLYIIGEVIVSSYFLALFLGVNIVLLIYIIINKIQKKRFKDTFEVCFEAMYSGDYSTILGSTDNEIFILLNTVVAESLKFKDDVKLFLKLASALEKEEASSFVENSPNKNVNNAIRIIKNLEKENSNTRKISTEFFKNIKTGKFNDIAVDGENIIQQQLNTILHSMYIMNTNLRIVQSAIFQGVYGVELETDKVEGDFLNVTNKLTTMLKSVEKASENLKRGVLLMDESGFEDYVARAYKGNLVECFKAIEVVYENLTMSVDNIVYSLENNTKIDFDNVSELFNPIINAINRVEVDKFFEGSTKEESAPKFKEIKKYNTVNLDIINDIENSLKSIQSTIETGELNLSEENEEDSIELFVEEREKEEVLENNKELENDIVIENNERNKISIDLEKDEKIENIQDLEEKAIIEELDDLEEVEKVQELESIDGLDETTEELYNPQEHESTSEVEETLEIDNTEETIYAATIQSFDYDQEKAGDSPIVNSSNEFKLNDRNTSSLRSKVDTKREKLGSTGKSANYRKGVNTVGEISRESKKPLTYQEAIRSGRVDDTTKNTNPSFNNRRTETPASTTQQRRADDNRGKKEPMTYQKFLQKDTNSFGNNDLIRNKSEVRRNNNTVAGRTTPMNNQRNDEVNKNFKSEVNSVETKRPQRPQRQSSRTSFRDSALKEIDPTKKRTKLEENLGRKLSQKERTELDLYGEILDAKTRVTIETITDGKDLGGF